MKLIDLIDLNNVNYPIKKGFLMKNLALVFLTMVLVSGCATSPIEKINFGDKEYSKFKGGSIVITESEIKNIDGISNETISSYARNEIQSICKEGNFKLLSYERYYKSDTGLLIFLIYYFDSSGPSYKLNFECVYDSKK